MKINSQTPFTTRTQQAAHGIHGDFDQRNRSINPPLKEVSDDMRLYNEVFNSNGTPTERNTQQQAVQTGQDIIASASTIPQQIAQVTAMDSSLAGGDYSDPKAITQTEPEYDFLNDTSNSSMSAFENLQNDPNKNNMFGTWKRTEGSFKERIDQATADGKYNKVKRLEGRRDNFRDNNAASKAEIS